MSNTNKEENLQIHVAIHRDQNSLVHHAPLELNDYRLPCELIEEGLWIYGERLWLAFKEVAITHHDHVKVQKTSFMAF
jgi:hypothetical protein